MDDRERIERVLAILTDALRRIEADDECEEPALTAAVALADAEAVVVKRGGEVW